MTGRGSSPSGVRASREGTWGLPVSFLASLLLLLSIPLPSATAHGTALATSAGPAWVNVTHGQHGPPSQDGAMAYDARDHEAVLFAGVVPGVSARVNYTWTYGNGSWINVTGPVGPSPRAWPAMAYDPGIGAVLLFGGFDNGPRGGSGLNDTWMFRGGAWTNLLRSPSPPARGGAAMVYDRALHTMVLFGGSSCFTCAAATGVAWTLARNLSWVPAKTTGSPPSATWGGIAYDRNQSEVVAFGGSSSARCGCQVNSTWVLSGRSWTSVTAPALFAARAWGQMAFDRTLNETVVYGGWHGTSGFNAFNDTWAFTAHGWVRLNVTGPGLRAFGYMIWDPVVRGLLLYGGLDSGGTQPYSTATWVLR